MQVMVYVRWMIVLNDMSTADKDELVCVNNNGKEGSDVNKCKQ